MRPESPTRLLKEADWFTEIDRRGPVELTGGEFLLGLPHPLVEAISSGIERFGTAGGCFAGIQRLFQRGSRHRPVLLFQLWVSPFRFQWGERRDGAPPMDLGLDSSFLTRVIWRHR